MTRVTKLNILIKMFQAGRSREVTLQFIENVNLKYSNDRSQFVKSNILFRLVMNLTLSILFSFSVQSALVFQKTNGINTFFLVQGLRLRIPLVNRHREAFQLASYIWC